MHFQKTRHSNKSQKVNTALLVMATTDSFSLHGFIDCFNNHIGHAALLQSNAKWTWTFQLSIKISPVVSEIPVSQTET